jgi:hypothetical protein
MKVVLHFEYHFRDFKEMYVLPKIYKKLCPVPSMGSHMYYLIVSTLIQKYILLLYSSTSIFVSFFVTSIFQFEKKNLCPVDFCSTIFADDNSMFYTTFFPIISVVKEYVVILVRWCYPTYRFEKNN